MRIGVLFSNSNVRCSNHVFSAFCCHVIMYQVPGRYCDLVPMPPHLCWRKHDYVSSRQNDALGYWAIPLPKRPAGSISSLRRGDVKVSFPVVFDRFYGMYSLFHLHIITFLPDIPSLRMQTELNLINSNRPHFSFRDSRSETTEVSQVIKTWFSF